MIRRKTLIVSILVLAFALSIDAAKFNGYGQKLYTVETDHFRIHYIDGLQPIVKTVGARFEHLYHIYADIYGLTLPSKTDVVLQDGDESNGLTFPNLNFIVLWSHDFEFDLRGNHNYFDDVIAHEYAHQASIYTSLKAQPNILYLQLGYFSHENQSNRTEAMHVIPTDILPEWFSEGIAQFESSRQGGDSWDTHRDMIMRTLTASNKLLNWDHMQVFAGRGDDFEKTYDHGFSLVSYIAATYGYNKVVALLRECSRITRLDFDGSIKAVLGISASQLYENWKHTLEVKYKKQLEDVGTQVYGKKINKHGYDNLWPKFSPDGKKIYFLSNGKNAYGFKMLYSYNLSDTVKEDKKIKLEMGVSGSYDIHGPSKHIAYMSAKSDKSVLPASQGGLSCYDAFIDTMPPEKESFWSMFDFKKTERQITERKGIFSVAFSPSGDKLACARRKFDKFYLAVVDTNKKNFRILYPDTNSTDKALAYIYSISWSPDGHNIAFSYFDRKSRKIGIYDTLAHSFHVFDNSKNDNRDPFYSADGHYLYFSSDKTGIYNIYRYDLKACKLERVTNVSGGAFKPALSPDGKKLAYSGYDPDGFQIFLMDSITALSTEVIDTPYINREPIPPLQTKVQFSEQEPYSRIPHQFLCIPTMMTEQVVTQDNNANVGISTFKIGAIFNLLDPFSWVGMGTELGAYFLFDPTHILDLINLDQGGINTNANYDFGLYGSTKVFPFDVSFQYLFEGIAASDWFYDETEQKESVQPYNIQLQNFLLQLSYYADNSGDESSGLGLHLIAGLNSYDVSLLLDSITVFKYNLDKGYRAGTMATFGAQAVDPKMNISPKGVVARLQYDLWNQYSLKQENSFDENSSILKENYDTYLFNEISGHLKAGISAPWYDKHDIHLELQGAYIKLADNHRQIPSYYLPSIQVPGYAYYRQDSTWKDSSQIGTDSTKETFDTMLVTGNAVLGGSISYRFPLWPGSINKKWWIFYFNYLYGAANFSGGAGWMNPMDFFKFDGNDWLLSYGLELRLEAITFNTLPLAVSVRWDNGFSKTPAPSNFGGNRFLFSVGFNFDNWDLVETPDYQKPALLAK